MRKDYPQGVIKAFLEFYVHSSVRRRPCLDLREGMKEQLTVKSATTLQDVLSDLVYVADERVLQPKKKEDPRQASFWRISYSSREREYRSGPAYDIAKVRYVALCLAFAQARPSR